MKPLTHNQIAVLLPITLLIHQLEEYFFKFPQWYSDLLNAQLSDRDFITINSVGLILIGSVSLSYLLNKKNWILVAVGTLVFVNGVVHLILSFITVSYSPGTVSGLILFIPLGTITYQQVLPQLKEYEKIIAIATGVMFLFLVTMIAMNI